MYYYVRNGQSDIIGILDNNGIQVVYYQYDSWGNPLTPTGSLASTVGADNPFRYRGYYLDLDTGLYYLNSRYYDSTVGRFINADGLISASSSLFGTNMYGYCENNPINGHDPSGLFWKELKDFGMNFARVLGQSITTLKAITLAPISVGLMACAVGYGLATGDVSMDQVASDLSNLNFFNTDEGKVLRSNSISFYKGVPVMRQKPFTSFSFGAIFLQKNNYVFKNDVKHEYGHSVQLGVMMATTSPGTGAALYTGLVAIPSVSVFTYNEVQGINDKNYYKRSWEATADFFGGVSR
ncbi:MAG: RHS repeat-associated core domain-containing protein [Erysipelotrichaceae bacterium]